MAQAQLRTLGPRGWWNGVEDREVPTNRAHFGPFRQDFAVAVVQPVDEDSDGNGVPDSDEVLLAVTRSIPTIRPDQRSVSRSQSAHVSFAHGRLDRTAAPGPASADRLHAAAGACDAHCHIFGPAARFPFAADRTYTPPDAGFEQFVRLQERLGLTRAVFVQASCHGTDNSAMVDALSPWPRALRRRGDDRRLVRPTREIGALHDAGVRGARFNFVAHLGGAPDDGRVLAGRRAHRPVRLARRPALRRRRPAWLRRPARPPAGAVRHRPHGSRRRRRRPRSGAVRASCASSSATSGRG